MQQPDNFSYVVPVEYEILHTAENLFCFDPTCPCHENAENIVAVSDAVTNGLLTLDEATRLVIGKTI